MGFLLRAFCYAFLQQSSFTLYKKARDRKHTGIVASHIAFDSILAINDHCRYSSRTISATTRLGLLPTRANTKRTKYPGEFDRVHTILGEKQGHCRGVKEAPAFTVNRLEQRSMDHLQNVQCLGRIINLGKKFILAIKNRGRSIARDSVLR